MASRGPYDPEFCTQCGMALDYSYTLAEFGICQPCTQKLNNAFIAGFGLVEGEHYGLDSAGDVDYWDGDVTLVASAAWLHVCDGVSDWEAVPQADLVAQTRTAGPGRRPLRVSSVNRLNTCCYRQCPLRKEP